MENQHSQVAWSRVLKGDFYGFLALDGEKIIYPNHTHRIHGAAIYGAPWIPSIYPLYVSICTSTMDASWV